MLLYCLIWVIRYFPYCSVTVHTKPLDIVYNRSTIGRVQNFFSTPLPRGNLKDKLQLQGLKNTLGELFESEDRVSDVEVTSGLQFKDQSVLCLVCMPIALCLTCSVRVQHVAVQERHWVSLCFGGWCCCTVYSVPSRCNTHALVMRETWNSHMTIANTK